MSCHITIICYCDPHLRFAFFGTALVYVAHPPAPSLSESILKFSDDPRYTRIFLFCLVVYRPTFRDKRVIVKDILTALPVMRYSIALCIDLEEVREPLCHTRVLWDGAPGRISLSRIISVW
jgi:hypothetical protein